MAVDLFFFSYLKDVGCWGALLWGDRGVGGVIDCDWPILLMFWSLFLEDVEGGDINLLLFIPLLASQFYTEPRLSPPPQQS